MQYLGAISKNNTKISVCLQGKAFNITVIYVPTTAEEAEVDTFYEDLQDLLELTLKKKKCPFHHRGLECTIRKSTNIQTNRRIGSWNTK